MTAPIIISLRPEGVSEVLNTLKSIKSVLIDLEHESIRSAESASKKRLEIIKNEVKDKEAILRASAKVEESLSQALSNKNQAKRALSGTNSAHSSAFGGGASSSFSEIGSGGSDTIGLMKAGAIVGGAAALMKGGIELATAALKQFASFVLQDVIKPAMELETKSAQIANSSMGQVTSQEIQSNVRAASLKHNVGTNELLEGQGLFQDLTGKSKMGFELMDTIATISKGRGFDSKELYSLAGNITNEGDTTKNVQDKLLKLLAQGDTGSIPLKSIAKLGGKLSAVAGKFQGEDGLSMASALLQTAKPKIGSEDEAMTGLSKFTQESLKLGKKVDRKSVIKDASGVEQLADPAKFIGDIFRKTQGNVGKLTKLGFTDESQKFIGAYSNIYSDNYKNAKARGENDKDSKDEGAKAVEEFIKSLAKANTSLETERDKENTVLQTSGQKWETAMNLIKDKLLMVMPEVSKFVDEFTKMAPDIANAGIILSKAMIAMAELILGIMKGLGSDENTEGKPEIDEEAKKFGMYDHESFFGRVNDTAAEGMSKFYGNFLPPMIMKPYRKALGLPEEETEELNTTPIAGSTDKNTLEKPGSNPTVDPVHAELTKAKQEELAVTKEVIKAKKDELAASKSLNRAKSNADK